MGLKDWRNLQVYGCLDNHFSYVSYIAVYSQIHIHDTTIIHQCGGEPDLSNCTSVGLQKLGLEVCVDRLSSNYSTKLNTQLCLCTCLKDLIPLNTQCD